MRLARTALLLASSLLVPAQLLADDRPGHFKGEPVDTLPEAVAQFSEYNDKLEAALAKGTLGPEDLHAIHMLTYSLENAIEKIDDAVDGLKDTLEHVHKASERNDPEVVQRQGEAYLDVARKLMP